MANSQIANSQIANLGALPKIPMRPLGYYSPPKFNRCINSENDNLSIQRNNTSEINIDRPSNQKFLDLDVAYLLAANIEKLILSREKKDYLYPKIHKKVYEQAKEKNIFTFSDFETSQIIHNNKKKLNKDNHKEYLKYFSKIINNEIYKELNQLVIK